MRSMTLAGIILVALVRMAVNLLADPQELDASHMQTMYGGTCYSRSNVSTSSCSPTWTCSSSRPQGGTDYTDLLTQQINYVTNGSSYYSTNRNRDRTCKVTSFRPKSSSHRTCSQRRLTPSYWRGPKFSLYGSCYSGGG